MEQLGQVWAWVQSHPLLTVAVVVYVFANFAPRPHPDKLKGWEKKLWQIVDRLCVLTAGKMPGGLKLPMLSASPSTKPPDKPDDKPDDKEEEADDDGKK